MNSIRLSRLVRRLMLPVTLLLALALWWSYGWLTVPAGMDTMLDEYPPGTVCVIDKHPGVLRPGQVVFLEYGGGLLLSRVARVDGDRFWVAHDSRGSRFPDGDALGPQPVGAVRALVLTSLRPDGAGAEVPGGGR